MLKLLVTGGAGFIGSNFVTRTLETMADVHVTVLDSLTYAGNLKNLDRVMSDIRFVHGDIRDEQLVEKLVSRSDAVLNFAAESHNDNSLHNPKIFYETNVLGTLNLASSCAANDVRLHHVSTDEVYGDLPLESDEEFGVTSPYKPSSPYSASKAASDHLVRAWVRSFGLKATISNCSNNYGPMQHSEKFIPATIRSIAKGVRPKIYGDGKNVRDWIHVDDHTDGIWQILASGAIGSTYLLGSQDRLSNLELVRAILGYMGAPETFVEFVSDRPGHDRKYAVNPDSSLQIGWKPKKGNLTSNLGDLVKYYSL